MFLDKRIITGIKTINVPTIAINVLIREVPIIRNAITKAATAKAIPTA
jgi:hypothetical protein